MKFILHINLKYKSLCNPIPTYQNYAYLFLFLLSFITLNCYSGVQANFYVSPNGNDNYPGSLMKPFATIQKAREVVQTINGNMTGDIIVNLREGLYELSAPFILSSVDNGTNGYNIIYQAYQCEKPVISGGIKVNGWKLYDTVKNIYKTYIDTSIDTRQLYVNGVRAIRARSVDASGWTESGDGYNCPSEVMKWENINQLCDIVRETGFAVHCYLRNGHLEKVYENEPTGFFMGTGLIRRSGSRWRF